MVLVGCPSSDAVGKDAGAAFAFDLSSGLEVLQLFAPDSQPEDGFGCAVAVDGSIAVIGAPSSDDRGPDSGSAYLFDLNTGQAFHKLVPVDGFSRDGFGSSVAIQDQLVLVGAPSHSTKGVVYVFDVDTGAELRQLIASDGVPADGLGEAVALDGGLALIGAPNHLHGTSRQGGAFVFDPSTGAQLFELFPSVLQDGSYFGSSVDLAGCTAIVGAMFFDGGMFSTGAACLFDVTTGRERFVLAPSDPQFADYYGRSVAVDGRTAVIGAQGSSVQNGGTVYLVDVETGLELLQLQHGDSGLANNFGTSVAIRDDRVLVGDPFGRDTAGLFLGYAYLFDGTSPVVPASATTRNGANETRLYAATLPVLGLDWEADVDASGHAAGIIALVAYDRTSSGTFLSGGELLVDPSGALLLSDARTHAGGVERFSFPVPADGSLFGFTAYAQAVIAGAPSYELTNALDLVAGE